MHQKNGKVKTENGKLTSHPLTAHRSSLITNS